MGKGEVLERAQTMIAQHGRDAAARALLTADDALDCGNTQDFRSWLRIAAAIRNIQLNSDSQ